MRCRERLAAAIALTAIAHAGCAEPLEHERSDTRDADTPPIPESCPLLVRDDALAGATGRVQLTPLDSGTLVAADAVLVGEGELPSATFVATDLATCARPSAAPVPIPLDLSAFASGLDARFGAVVRLPDERVVAFVFLTRGFEPIGTALATWDGGRFVAGHPALFAAGRPWGEAALAADGYLYAYGAAEAGFLAEALYVARAPLEHLDDPSAWRFYRDGDDFGTDPDEAWPVLSGGGGATVMALPDDADGRVVIAYHAPLGDRVVLRTGLGPTGPWSPPTEVARCAWHGSPDDLLCGALAWLPSFSGPDGLALAMGFASFDAVPAAVRRTRLALLPWP